MRVSSKEYDICIVGSGVAGSALAAYLGKQNLNIAVVERKWSQPDEIIGELLQPSGVLKVQEMGLGDAFDKIDAQPIEGYIMYLGDQPQQLSYPDSVSQRHEGLGFRYGRFVQGLRSLSEPLHSVERVQGSVTSLIVDPNDQIKGVRYRDEDGEQEIHAKLTVISQGSMAGLRSPLNKAKSQTKGYMIGVVLEHCELPFPNHGHVIMADPAPVLAYPVGTNKVRVLIDIPKELPVMKGEELTNYLVENIAPQMPNQLRDAFRESVLGQKLKGKPTHLLASRPLMRDGAVLLGDALNMRHPTTGSGMTVALTDVKDLADRLIGLPDLSPKLVREEVASFYKNRHKENATVNILAYALYRVFRHKTLRKACFDYLKKGGKFSAEPMSILSGISRSRITLLKHFFAVALLGVKQQLIPFPTPKRLGNSFRLLKDSLEIIVPLVRDEVPKVKA